MANWGIFGGRPRGRDGGARDGAVIPDTHPFAAGVRRLDEVHPDFGTAGAGIFRGLTCPRQIRPFGTGIFRG
jgi:hypothetical protein